MNYKNVRPGRFLSRPNRFFAEVELDDTILRVHVKNTGRCKELLIPGRKVYLAKAENPARKTLYDLIAVEKPRDGKPNLLINLDSQVVNDAAEDWLRTRLPYGASLRREVTYGSSRFDFQIVSEKGCSFLEVKGVTLEDRGIVRFPDAPTERGVKHLQELRRAKQAGFGAGVLFVIQMKEAQLFQPNEGTHPAFGQALRDAYEAGVQLLCMDCLVAPDSIRLDAPVPMQLQSGPSVQQETLFPMMLDFRT